MSDVTAATTGDFDFAEGIFASLDQGDLSMGISLGASNRSEKSRRAAADDDDDFCHSLGVWELGVWGHEGMGARESRSTGRRLRPNSTSTKSLPMSTRIITTLHNYFGCKFRDFACGGGV